MRRTVLIAGLALIAPLARASAQPAAAQGAADSVRALDAAWARSYATHDTVFARALFAPELAATSSGGVVKTREVELDDVRPAAPARSARIPRASRPCLTD